MTPGLVIFDCDGVLVDSEGISMRELTRAITAIGGTLDKDAVQTMFTGMALGDIDLFPPERIFSATMVEHGKPAPDLYLHAAAACGFVPDACVVVEDSPTGVIAARAAGMRVLGYVAPSSAGNGARLAALGAEVFHDMREVPERVNAVSVR